MAEVKKLVGSESPLEVGQKINEIIEKGVGGAGLQLFDTILKDHVLTYEESKGLALQGTYVYKEALAGSHYGYPDFYNKCLEEFQTGTASQHTYSDYTYTIYIHTNGHRYYDIADKEGIDAYFNNYGKCWLYGVDTENERIFLPRNNWFDQMSADTSTVGFGVHAGLPDHTHTYTFKMSEDAGGSGRVTYGSNTPGSDQTLTTNGVVTSSSSIYGKSDTVQPNAVKKLLYICVGNTTNYQGITEVVNQGMTILEQVNQGIESRIKLDGSNAQFPYLVETYVNGTSWYRIWSDGFKQQGGIVSVSSFTTSKTTSIALLKPFTNINYSAIFQVTDGGNNWARISTQVNEKTVSSMSLQEYQADGSGGSFAAHKMIWYAYGY